METNTLGYAKFGVLKRIVLTMIAFPIGLAASHYVLGSPLDTNSIGIQGIVILMINFWPGVDRVINAINKLSFPDE